jgi:multidrug efflux pump subunit AcrA (membrane-fusion protein)
MSAPVSSPFREQALSFQRRGALRGDVLHITPALFNAVLWFVLALAVCCIAFVIEAEVTDYATGPAIVQLEQRREVTATRAGVVAQIDTRIGARVHAGDPLVHLYATGEAAEASALERELADQIVVLLRNPGDRAAREAVLALRTKRDVAANALERSVLRAPIDGMVSDLRVRPGQPVDAGAPLLALQGESQAARVTALLPGPQRPRLHAGMPLRLHLHGFERNSLELTIDAVDAQVLGPAEALRALGTELNGAFEVQGPLVLVHARFAADSFESRGVRYQLHHGMTARAEVAVQREPLLYAWLPGLEEAISDVF